MVKLELTSSDAKPSKLEKRLRISGLGSKQYCLHERDKIDEHMVSVSIKISSV